MYSRIRLSGRLLAATIALVLMVSIAAFIFIVPLDTQAAAEPPDWNEGDGVAAGVELDVLQLYNAHNEELVEMLQEAVEDMSGGDASLDDFSVTKGTIKAFVSLGVTDVSNGEVTVTERMGFEIQFKLNAKTTVSDMPVAGVYDWDANLTEDQQEDMETITSLEIRIAFTQTFSVTFDEETMDIVEVSFSLRPSFMMNAQFSNLPWFEDDDVNETEEVSYGSLNVFFKIDVKSTLTLGFLPPLKLFDLPMEVGDDWNTMTDNISIDLQFEGVVDLQITGTHYIVDEANDEIDEMFEDIQEEMPNATGLDSFPIVIQDISIPAEYFQEDEPEPIVEEEDDGPFAGIDFEIVDGAFPTEMIEVPMQFNLTCTGSNESDLLVLHGLMTENSTIYWVWLDGEDVPGVVDIPLSDLFDFHPDVNDLYIGGIPYMAEMADFNMWDEAMDDAIDDMEQTMVTAVEGMTNGTVNMSSAFTFESMSLAAANDGLDSITTTQDGIATAGDEDESNLVDEDESNLVDDVIGLFTEPPYIGAIAVVVLVLIMGMMVARRG